MHTSINKWCHWFESYTIKLNFGLHVFDGSIQITLKHKLGPVTTFVYVYELYSFCSNLRGVNEYHNLCTKFKYISLNKKQKILWSISLDAESNICKKHQIIERFLIFGRFHNRPVHFIVTYLVLKQHSLEFICPLIQ